MAHDRFVNNDLLELQEANRSPIFGYQHLSIPTLDEAIKKIIPLVPDVVNYVSRAKEKCNQQSTILTQDESAAVYLYSMPIPFFSCLNDTLRAENRHALKPWFAYLKLFMAALEKLPSTKKTVWRGVAGDVGSIFVDNDTHLWWSINSCSMAVNIVQPFLGETGTLFAIDAIHGKDISEFTAIPDEQEVVLMPGTRVHARCQSLSFIDRLFVVHLEEENPQSAPQTEPSYFFERIKHEYQRNSRIERIMNPSKSFPIEQSYINLAIVEIKEQQEKEKKLLNATLNNEIIGTYEEIYGTKTKIEIQDIFERCTEQTKHILVLGRAGIGKTTFCRYVAYQWARGAIWQQYQLIIFIRLRSLTESRYPPLASRARYSLIDLVKTEYCCHNLREKDETIFQEQLDTCDVLWLLDGYDEIVQDLPSHLHYLFEQLLKTPHHILTSRPYLNTLSYNVQLEITGFTDDNIKEYVKQFYNQINDEIVNAPLLGQKLLSFLKCNSRIWGIVHIPVNLELICSLWCDTNWSETVSMTMTNVYDKMTEWLCRRHLEKQNISSSQMAKEDVYAHCHKELAFLESLAFNGMKTNSIILPPKLLRMASKESACSLQHQPHLLNIGILKSLDYKPVGTCIEADKNHYFLHLSFQEHFAARYLVGALSNGEDQKKKAIDFIKADKYNQRFELVFTFASGLLIDSDDEECMNLFWEILLGEPLDLIGLRHLQLVISCIEETGCNRRLPRFRESMNLIIKWIKYAIAKEHNHLYTHVEASLRRSPSVVNQTEILDTFLTLYQSKDFSIRKKASLWIATLPITDPNSPLIKSLLQTFHDHDAQIRSNACEALGKIGEIKPTNEVINILTSALGDTDDYVRWKACEALGKLGENAKTNDVINRLMNAVGDKNQYVRRNACETLGKMGEKAITDEVINRMVSTLGDTIHDVRLTAYETLQKMTENAVNNEVANKLVNAFSDINPDIRRGACGVIGGLSEKAATDEVINRLINALADTNHHMRRTACEALGKLGEKVATSTIIGRLVSVLADRNHRMRSKACQTLGKLGEIAATNEVVSKLVSILGDTNSDVRCCACAALGRMGEKAANSEVISGLLAALEDSNSEVVYYASEALGRMGEKVATEEVINRLICVVEDVNADARRIGCVSLGKIGEKAATDAGINALVSAVGDSNNYVKCNACEALANMGEKAATNEVIDSLVSAFSSSDNNVQRSASEAIVKLCEKRTSDEVFKRLLCALGDINCDIRWNTCKVLGVISQKIAIDGVIDGLVGALDDTDVLVKWKACNALGKIGRKVADNQVINGLISALGSTNHYVRRLAYKTLSIIGENAATDKVINELMKALGDTSYYIRQDACEALGNIGEKAATSEVISRLMNALEDTNDNVRRSACEAFGKIGEKAVTNQVIDKLAIALGDTNPDVRRNACRVLCKTGEKAATNEVIRRLLKACNDRNPEVQHSAVETIEKILCSLSCMSHFDSFTVEELSLFTNRITRVYLNKVSPKKFVEAFLKTRIRFWLPVIKNILVRHGNAVTITGNTITLYSSNELVELSFGDREVGEQLKNALAIQVMDDLE